METKAIESFLFSVHIILLCVKIWAVWIIAGSLKLSKSVDAKKYLMVLNPSTVFFVIVTFAFVLLQIWFIYCFFVPLDLYYYEYAAVLDQIILTILIVNHLTKEDKKHG